MRAISLTISQFFIIVFITFSQSAVKDQFEIKFDIRTDKDIIIANEPLIITASLLLRGQPTADHRFSELGFQMPKIIDQLTAKSIWYHQEAIGDIQQSTYDDGKFQWIEYKLARVVLFPSATGSFRISPIDLNILKIDFSTKKESTITLTSQARTIKINPIPVASNELPKYFGDYRMVGDFKYFEDLTNIPDKAKQGDTLTIKYRIVGNGASIPIQKWHASGDQIKIISNNYLITDTVRFNKFKQRLSAELIFVILKPGILDLSSELRWSYFSPTSKSIQSIGSKLVVDVAESTANIGETADHQYTLVFDNSESMLIEDYIPNRRGYATRLVREMIKMNQNIKLMTFAGEVHAITSHHLRYDSLKKINPKSGTAVGDAIFIAAKSMPANTTDQQTIIIIGDGDNTAGHISADDAARLASEQNIRIVSIGIGSEGKVPFGFDYFGKQRWITNTFSDRTLKNVASQTGGYYIHCDKDGKQKDLAQKILKKPNSQ